jgi:hypothetical protein
METEIWRYSFPTTPGINITGFDVEAPDGSIGHVEYAADDSEGGTSLVVDTGPWIFGKRVMLPAGVINRIDLDDEKVWVNRTKDEIKNAPEYDETLYEGEAYRGELAGYYGASGRGWRDPIVR